jgi:hypothetical protein
VIQLRKRHGLRRSARSQRPIVRAEMAATTPKLTSIAASRAALKRLKGAGTEATFGAGATSGQAGVFTASERAGRGGSGSETTTGTTGASSDSADSCGVRGEKDGGAVRFACLHDLPRGDDLGHGPGILRRPIKGSTTGRWSVRSLRPQRGKRGRVRSQGRAGLPLGGQQGIGHGDFSPGLLAAQMRQRRANRRGKAAGPPRAFAILKRFEAPLDKVFPPGSHCSLIRTDGVRDAAISFSIGRAQKGAGPQDRLIGRGPLT